MNAIHRLFLSLLLPLALLAGGCASVPMAPDAADAQAKTFDVRPGKANIYVYRHEVFGGAVPMTVTLDGRVAGQSGPKTFFMWEVEPGPHEVSSVAENTAKLRIDAQAGRSYYVWQEVKMGFWLPRTELHAVDEATGRAAVLQCKRVASEI